ncbi:hypothetical protein EYS14_17565 [Alteromonadaceae bacterium M269]|nr:hypothetical protein EYS14_17565 [Alteromonadaceae bacterium M269]
MTTEQILEKLHQICSSFPQIEFSDRDGKLDRTSDKCFAYSCVKRARVYISFRLVAEDTFKALWDFGIFSFKWRFSQGVWLTVPVEEDVDWDKLQQWIATSYQVVAGEPVMKGHYPELLATN